MSARATDPEYRRVMGLLRPGEQDSLREAAAIGWDACVAAMRYEDGSHVEIVTMVNPYRPAPVVAPSAEGSE